MVSLGKVKGVRKLKSFSTLEEAQIFQARCEEKNALKNPAALSDLDELGKAAIRHAQAKLGPFDSSINEAVDFFIKFAKPPKGKITIQEAMELFKKDKTVEGASKTYLKKSERCFFTPFRDAFKNCLMSDVSPTQAHKYIYRQKTWCGTTKNTHNRHLRALYSFAAKKGYVTINPFASVPIIKEKGKAVKGKILTVEDTQKLLQYALDKNRKAECASMVLIFFCGVRVEEVDRLNWDDVKLDAETPHVEIDDDNAKAGRRRVNDLPGNAVHWLKECRLKGKISPDNYLKRMQRLRKRAGITYPQNAARHSFASYHVAMHEAAERTAYMLGHPNANLLYNTYRSLVGKKDAQKYWDIVPKAVEAKRVQEMERIRQRFSSAS